MLETIRFTHLARGAAWRFQPLLLLFLLVLLQGDECAANEKAAETALNRAGKVVKSEAEWKKVLTPQQYHVTREQGTETAFTGKYYNHHEKGVYRCVACGNPLFDSKTKFDSGTGWPSFYQPLEQESVEERPEFGRREVVCKKCDSHLGHVFTDGPEPTNLRYCINSCALDFQKVKKDQTAKKDGK